MSGQLAQACRGGRLAGLADVARPGRLVGGGRRRLGHEATGHCDLGLALSVISVATILVAPRVPMSGTTGWAASGGVQGLLARG